MKKIFILLIIFLPLLSIAQKQGNIWYFGADAGLDFNSGIPIPLTNGQTYTSYNSCALEGTAIISDSSGALLFYTNGQTIWNKNQQIMLNGDSLLGNYSSTQAALIVPQPGCSRYFYVFTTDDFCNNNLKYGFRYSIVDICLDNGLGAVMLNQKNLKLLDTVCEKITAVRHANGIDYWVIVHKYFSDAFYSYHLSSAGIVDTVISHIGSIHPDTADDQYTGPAIGQLKSSPNGNKLAIVTGNSGNANNAIAEYFDFDNNTGIISNCVSIKTNPNNYYGVSFSPDNSKIYITYWLNSGSGVCQFNLNAGDGNADSVIASRTIIINNVYNYWALQLATDGKIYVALSGNYISVINNPNSIGVNCNFVDSAIYLNGKICSFGLPNFIDSYDYSNTIYNCETTINEEQAYNNNAVLYQNSPNPFGEGTMIKYFVPDYIEAQIIFYDMFGNQIKVFKIAEKGMGQLSVSATNLAAGMYSYSLMVAGKIVDTKKMIKQ